MQRKLQHYEERTVRLFPLVWRIGDMETCPGQQRLGGRSVWRHTPESPTGVKNRWCGKRMPTLPPRPELAHTPITSWSCLHHL